MVNNQLSNGPKIVVIGGGTGLSVILRGIKTITDNLTAVVTVADDGGGSGILREDLGMLPPGDIRSCILALADEEGLMQELLKYRFTDGMLKGQNFGNLLIAALNGIFGSFEEAVVKTHEILRVKGRVVPVTNHDVRLCAELENGNVICGESQIQQECIQSQSPIKRVFLEPNKPKATKEAIDAILKADIILIGPVSLYTSIIPNLLVEGITQAIKEATGRKILICNIMTQPGETDDFSVWQHYEKACGYIGAGVIDYVVANNSIINESDLEPYTEDGATQVIPTIDDRSRLNEQNVSLIENNFIDIRKGYIRHDAERIANVIYGLINYS